jgi:ankyrin repeat protein
MNAFHWSIKLEMKEKQDLLLSHPLLDINQKTRNGYTPLTLCVKYNNLDRT